MLMCVCASTRAKVCVCVCVCKRHIRTPEEGNWCGRGACDPSSLVRYDITMQLKAEGCGWLPSISSKVVVAQLPSNPKKILKCAEGEAGRIGSFSSLPKQQVQKMFLAQPVSCYRLRPSCRSMGVRCCLICLKCQRWMGFGFSAWIHWCKCVF